MVVTGLPDFSLIDLFLLNLRLFLLNEGSFIGSVVALTAFAALLLGRGAFLLILHFLVLLWIGLLLSAACLAL